ncbi:hypothetical protein BKA67DRAFT_660126 [Truncatella angustata]|uniref:Uncharacterized protein n=1 Tax=Truncatella angustata TaxID=152316 RepID=A0A9P8UJW8_9PEZI|nr:uncharacterized protein BKA67DRAFT_660126 [Truncatella angustata]KAH6653531.1 hypothetical protein BKA67DRAFT_660126 [Truncatella angustata]
MPSQPQYNDEQIEMIIQALDELAARISDLTTEQQETKSMIQDMTRVFLDKFNNWVTSVTDMLSQWLGPSSGSNFQNPAVP